MDFSTAMKAAGGRVCSHLRRTHRTEVLHNLHPNLRQEILMVLSHQSYPLCTRPDTRGRLTPCAPNYTLYPTGNVDVLVSDLGCKLNF